MARMHNHYIVVYHLEPTNQVAHSATHGVGPELHVELEADCIL